MTQTPDNPPALATGTMVKPLVWTLGDDEITAEAFGVKRFYRIYGQAGRWELIYPYDAAMRYDGPFETQIRAREAAQAEYERRILSAVDQPANSPMTIRAAAETLLTNDDTPSATLDGRNRTIAFDLVAFLHRQREFSLRTFGPGPRTKGIVDHIRKELAEIEAEPSDVEEWIDVILLALDGPRRAGWEPEQIADAIIAKQAKNEARHWPDWRTADIDQAIEHVREPEQGTV